MDQNRKTLNIIKPILNTHGVGPKLDALEPKGYENAKTTILQYGNAHENNTHEQKEQVIQCETCGGNFEAVKGEKLHRRQKINARNADQNKKRAAWQNAQMDTVTDIQTTIKLEKSLFYHPHDQNAMKTQPTLEGNDLQS